MVSWVREPRVTGGQEMSDGRSLVRYLKRFDLPLSYSGWAPIAQNRDERLAQARDPAPVQHRQAVRAAPQRRHQEDTGAET